MDCEQKLCHSIVKDGHNLFILGQAGSGKTFTVRNIVNALKTSNNISLTCYTGIACLQYKGVCPSMTLHKFAGLEDGRNSKEKVVHLLQTDEHFQETLRRIQQTDLLIVDEVSMVSKKTLETVEFVCRQLKDKSKVFGGMQVVLVGDIFQLPPIKDELYGENGDYCFNANFFPLFFTHVIVLSTIHRQSEPDLVRAINEHATGRPTLQTHTFISSLSRPLEDVKDKSQVVRLHARNFDADVSNYRYLLSINADLHCFESDDNGDPHYLKKIIVQKHLGVKVGTKVMLLRNMDDVHVNGSVGCVVKVSNDWIQVDFAGVIIRVERYTFSKFDPVTGLTIARRRQFPLKVAHAITIHTSQGMRLPLVEVDCKHVTNPGQLGVAIGRAISSAGLRVIHYSTHNARMHPQCVYDFYNTINSHTSIGNCSDCCKVEASFIVEDIESKPEIPESESEDEVVVGLFEFDTVNVKQSLSGVGQANILLDFEAALQDFQGSIPWILATADGMPVKTDRAKLRHSLE